MKKIKCEKLAIYKIKKEVFWLAKIESIDGDAHNFWALHSRVTYIKYWKINVVQGYKYHIVGKELILLKKQWEPGHNIPDCSIFRVQSILQKYNSIPSHKLCTYTS